MRRRAVAAGAVALIGAVPLWWSQPAASQETAQLEIQAQTFAVSPGGTARFEFIVTGDFPEIAPTTTTTTSTTTTTTTTTTSTTTTTTVAADVETAPPSPTPSVETTAPSATTTPATTTTTTIPVPAGPRMTVQVRSYRAVSTRDGVAAAVDGETGALVDILEFDLSDVAVFDEETGERRIDLSVPIASDVADVNALDLLESGVHPITVQVRRDGRLVAFYTTFVEVVDPDGPGRGPFAFSVLAAVADTGPFPDADELDAAASEIADVVDVLAAVDQPVTVALPPTYLSTVIGRSDQLGGALTASLGPGDRLLSLPDQPLEPSAAVDAGLHDEFARGVATGERQLEGRFPATPTTRGAWNVTDPLTVEGATAIRNLGVPLLVIPFDHYQRLGNNLGTFTDPTLMFNTTLTDDSSMRMMVVDPITELLEPTAAGSPIERAVRLMADTSALRYQLDPDRRSMILTTPDLGVPDADVLRELSVFVTEHPHFEFAPIGQLPDLTNSMFLDGAPVVLELDTNPSTDLNERVEHAQSARLRSADTATMLPVGDSRPGEWDQDLRTALSTGLTDDESGLIVDAVDAEVADIRSQIVQPEPFSFTIAGDAAPIPLRIENRGDTALSVRVMAAADKLTFPEGELDVVLEPNQINNVDIPVEARSNGVFPVVVEIRTPAGTPVTETVELTARVSTLTGLGRLVTVGAILVLATWWFSYFRRRRIAERTNAINQAQDRHPAAVAEEPAEDVDDADQSDDPPAADPVIADAVAADDENDSGE